MLSSFKIYSLQFWLLCFSSFLFFSSFNMIIPELPDYLRSMGGEDYLGLYISLFTLTAGLSRPFSGKLTDKVGRIPVMVFGALVCFVIGFLYPILTTVGGFLFLRFLHGFSTGFKPTGTVAYVADIVPLERRGEAMGLASTFGTLGMASGPAIGSEITRMFSLNTLFYTSSGAALLSILILIGMKETLENPERFKLDHLKIGMKDIYEGRVLIPSVVMLLSVFSFGIVLTIIPDKSVAIGLENKGTFFTVFTIASLLVRFLAGRASDRFGRHEVLAVACIFYAFGMYLIGIAETKVMFFTAAVIFGLGTGMNSPTIFAWAVDLVDARSRGKAMATIFIALELGLMMGSLLSGWTYANNPDNFAWTFWMGAIVAAVAAFLLILLIFNRKSLNEPN